MTKQNTSNDTPVDQKQPLIQHLIELRNHLLRAVLCVIVVFASLYYFANDIYLMVAEPLRALMPAGSTMIATDVASPFFAPFKLTLMVSIFISMPFVLYQIWRFIAPALYAKEKKLAFPLLFSSIVLFYAGIAFAYFVVFPLIFGFFTSTGPAGITIMTDISSYLDFVLKLFFAFGIVFEIPIAIIILVSSGITNVESLSQKRPYLIVACFVVGMLLTPPDVISQILLAVPMWMLFEVGLLFAKMVENKTTIDTES